MRVSLEAIHLNFLARF